MAASGFDLGPPPFCYTPRMARFGRNPKAEAPTPAKAEPPVFTGVVEWGVNASPEAQPESIGGLAISIDGRTSIVGGTPRHTPTHDDEW